MSLFNYNCRSLKLVSNLISKWYPMRNFNITSSTHIEQIGNHLLSDNQKQTIILNLPAERNCLLPNYLLEKSHDRNLLLLLDQRIEPSSLNIRQDADQSVSYLNMLEPVNLLKIRSRDKVHKSDQLTIYDQIVANLEEHEWRDQAIAKLFMIVPDKRTKVMRSFIGQIINKSGLFSKGRVELYLIITELEYKRLRLKSYSPIFFYNAYKFTFDYELLDKFIWADLKITTNKQDLKFDQYGYMVKFVPKISLADHEEGYCNLFANFLSKLAVSKRNLVIAFFEVWFPGIGLKLIDMNYSVFTKFENLDYEDYVRIFDLLMKEEKDAFIEILTYEQSGGTYSDEIKKFEI